MSDKGKEVEKKDLEEEEENDDEKDNDEGEEDEDDEEEDGDNEEDEDEEEDDDFDEESEGNITITLQDNVVDNAAIDAAKRLHHAQVHYTPNGNYAAMRTTGDIFSLGSKIPWEIVNPSGVHPQDANKSIFSYDLSQLPDNVESKPWTAPKVDMNDWFNYGFNEQTWEIYRKKMLKVIKNKKYESKISVLSKQTKSSK